jgi:hypothetical protein
MASLCVCDWLILDGCTIPLPRLVPSLPSLSLSGSLTPSLVYLYEVLEVETINYVHPFIRCLSVCHGLKA